MQYPESIGEFLGQCNGAITVDIVVAWNFAGLVSAEERVALEVLSLDGTKTEEYRCEESNPKFE
jgi:hypothetical protein